nr:Gfo/Idh/MocA family oxidoreductase [uncultured Actinoplanes sp.]
MTLSVALAGAGIIGRNHVAAISRLDSLRIIGIADPDTRAASALAATIPGPPGVYGTLRELLARTPADLVVICTPSGQHVSQALEAVAAGAHVVIEKPLDVTVEACRPLIGAGRPGQVVSVISQHRFDPATAAVAAAVADGTLGTLTSAVASVPWWRSQEYYDSAGWRGTLALDGGGALMNQGVHTVDLLTHLMGVPSEVFAWTGLVAHEGIEVEDVAAAVLRFPSGALATLHATTAAYPGTGVRLAVHGTRGSAVLDDDQLVYASFPGARPPSPPPDDAFVRGHLRQYEDILDAIARGRPPAVGVGEAVEALAVVEAVYRSAATGRPVALKEILP